MQFQQGLVGQNLKNKFLKINTQMKIHVSFYLVNFRFIFDCLGSRGELNIGDNLLLFFLIIVFFTLRVPWVSSSDDGATVQMIPVLAFPPRDVCRILVSLLSRNDR